ncbi:carboxypeptidase M32 [Geotalea sp. SG265]|uniref:carboxypeptidase M32 n=1 Tax=Geotalea sp. SG265 TaxID=2922867 RepID=UPI001FAF54A8|nr:carboxypeptidase M32 [Geotalea sp. SG265]
MKDDLTKLKHKLIEISDIESTNNLLEWDELVYMPPKGAYARGRQKATLARLAHEKFTSPSIGKLLDKLLLSTKNLPYESDDTSLIRVTKREYEKAIKVPPRFITVLEEHKSASYEAWCRAREEDNFSIVAPYLQTTIDLSREYANFFSPYEHIADPLIQNEEYGMKVSLLRPVFKEIKEGIVPLVKEISSKAEPDDQFLFKSYPQKKQLDFGLKVIKAFGYNFKRGRQDLSIHPFTINMSLDDVRITTNVNKNSFFESFSSTLHEAGHAMYVQGISSKFDGTPLAKGASMGIHESQARLWENLVGRSDAFWHYFFPVLKNVFPHQLNGITVESFLRAINKVKPTLIRTEADEVTYNLHVMIRFDLELDLLEGNLEVMDLPDAWNARYASDLNIFPSNNINGVLQDVHWYCDLIGGGFQSYTLGNVISALCYDSAISTCPEIAEEIKNGKFDTLLDWLKSNIYTHGCKFTASELIHKFTAEQLSVKSYMKYLYTKYDRIYQMSN